MNKNNKYQQAEIVHRIRDGNRVRTQPPPPAPVNLEANLNFNVVLSTVSMEEWLTPMHCSKPWFISINSDNFSSFSVMVISSLADDWRMDESSLLMESTAVNTAVMAFGCLRVLSETPATNAFVFRPTFVLVISILSGMLDLMRVNSPDLNLIILPVLHQIQCMLRHRNNLKCERKKFRNQLWPFDIY